MVHLRFCVHLWLGYEFWCSTCVIYYHRCCVLYSLSHTPFIKPNIFHVPKYWIIVDTTHAHARAHTHTHVCAYAYIYVRTHTHIHTVHTHTHTRVRPRIRTRARAHTHNFLFFFISRVRTHVLIFYPFKISILPTPLFPKRKAAPNGHQLQRREMVSVPVMPPRGGTGLFKGEDTQVGSKLKTNKKPT